MTGTRSASYILGETMRLYCGHCGEYQWGGCLVPGVALNGALRRGVGEVSGTEGSRRGRVTGSG